MDTIRSTTDSLRTLASQLSDKSLGRALRNTMRKEARRVRKVAIRNLRSTPVHYTSALGRTLRADMTRDADGIYVTARASVKTLAGMHKNKKERYKPVLMWLADGTATRYTKSGACRGSVSGATYGGWLVRALQSEAPAMEANVMREIDVQIQKQIQKHGFS